MDPRSRWRENVLNGYWWADIFVKFVGRVSLGNQRRVGLITLLPSNHSVPHDQYGKIRWIIAAVSCSARIAPLSRFLFIGVRMQSGDGSYCYYLRRCVGVYEAHSPQICQS